jgi:hypothetical protein
MNATWVKNLALCALGCGMAAGNVAMAGPIGVTVDFSCADGQGVKTAGGNVCNPNGPGANTSIKSWSQGFTGDSGPGSINIATNPPAGKNIFWSPTTGDPVPGLATQGASNKATPYTLTVTDTGNYLFEFVGIDLGMAPDGKLEETTYTITGYDGATELFTESGEICQVPGPPRTETCTAPGVNWQWVNSTSSDLLTELVITTTDVYGVSGYDNLEVEAVVSPEPGTLFLLGTGLLGLAFIAFRKSRTPGLTLNT